jgi:putative tricarboxylic transport membrane protein
MASAGLGLLALLLIAKAFAGGWQDEEEKAVALDYRSLVFVIAGLVANVALIGPLGFTAASTALFVLITYGFGSRKPVRDALIGFSVALIAYFGFAKLLGVNIGAGIIERALGG